MFVADISSLMDTGGWFLWGLVKVECTVGCFCPVKVLEYLSPYFELPLLRFVFDVLIRKWFQVN